MSGNLESILNIGFSLGLGLLNATFFLPEQLKIPDASKDPDFGKDLEFLVTSKGYPFEKHHVMTDDGYVIEMHRVPYGRHDTLCQRAPTKCTGRPAILLNPSMLSTSDMYLYDVPDKSLGFVLADAGYDVWLANNRGTTYGRKHKLLSPDDKEFWQFSFHEHSLYDVPNQLDYVTKKTSQPKVFFLGTSQGTLTFFNMLSLKPDMNNKIRLFIGLGPYRTLGNFKAALINVVLPIAKPLLNVLAEISAGEFLPGGSILSKIISQLCASPFRVYCAELGQVMNLGKYYVNKTRLGIYFQHYPDASSIKNLMHYLQYVESGKAQYYDYGKEINMEYYDQETPPLYNLTNIRSPTALYYSDGDDIVATKEVLKLHKELGKLVVKSYHIKDPKFSHSNFITALNTGPIYKDIVDFLKKWKV